MDSQTKSKLESDPTAIVLDKHVLCLSSSSEIIASLTFDVRYGKFKMAERNDLVLVHFTHASHENVSGARAYVSFPDNDWLADTSKANDARTLLRAFDCHDWLETRVRSNR